GGRDADGATVDLAFHLGNDERSRFRCAGGGRNYRERRRARAPQILVRKIEHLLIVGVAVDGDHRSVLEPERVANDLHHRHQTVRGARRVGYVCLLCGIVFVVVHAHDDGDVLTFSGRGDQHLFGAAIDVLARGRRIGESTSGLEDYVHTEILPRQLTGIFLGENLDLVAIDDDRI